MKVRQLACGQSRGAGGVREHLMHLHRRGPVPVLGWPRWTEDRAGTVRGWQRVAAPGLVVTACEQPQE